MKKNTLSINLILNTIYQILLVAVPLVTAPYVSRVLKADGVGVYSYTHSLVTFFVLFAALGTISYGTREIARNRDNKKDYSRLFWEIECLVVLSTFVCLLLWSFLVIFSSEYKIFLLILSTQIIAVCFDISWLFAGLEKFKFTIIVNSLFKIAGCVLTFLLVKTTNDLWLYFLISSLTIFVGHLSMWVFLPFVVSKPKIAFKNIKTHLKGTLIYFVPSIAASIYTVLDKALIGLLITGTTTVLDENGNEVIKKLSELENGYYEQATKLINIVKAVAFTGIVGVMTSRASFLYQKDNKIEAKKILVSSFHLTSFLSIGACFGLCAIARTFIPTFFGDGYEKTITILYILSPLVFIISISNVLGGVYYTPAGKRKQSAIFLLIGAGINLVLNIPFILILKSIGAAIASLIAEIIISVLYLSQCKGAITFKELTYIVWKKIVSGLIMFACVFSFTYYLGESMNRYLVLLLQLIIGIVVYSCILCLLKDNSFSSLFAFFKTRKNSTINSETNHYDCKSDSNYD